MSDTAPRDPLASGLEPRIDMSIQHLAAPMLRPGKRAFVMLLQDRIDREARIAIAGREKDHPMAPRLQPGDQVPAMSLHPTHERLHDRLAHMRHHRDPHSAANGWATVRALLSSSRRMTLAVFA